MRTIKEIRIDLGWTQFELAKRMGVALTSISNWESGRYEPRVPQFRKLARVLDVKMEDLAMNDEDRKAASENADG